ncbi:MAG: hypothetical protein WAW02_02260 [Sideroxyarcus sp.]
MRRSLVVLLALASSPCLAVPDFSGVWQIALCYDGKDKPCGSAYFSLLQYGTRICGDHTFYTAGAGRMNEGEPGSVRGNVEGDTAVLLVRSGRNGALVRGKASRIGKVLRWKIVEELEPGEPIGDGLILGEGDLKIISNEVSNELKDACMDAAE